jgi:hypothetical protein
LFPSQDIMFLAGMTDKTLFHGRGILEMNVLNRKKIGNFPREADACVVMVAQSTTTQPR